ncbi:hypothetical protein PHBOTO_006457 [Pseudozyma hubeiensis]|nr:hypothetical protein PHBOTO_006457 [Pseudozyma hubeiensis]
MPKRTREQEDASSSSRDTTSAAIQAEEKRKRQKIFDYISAQTAVDPADQLRSDQLAFVPRSYQLELAQLAKAGNVLVCLDTGSGKTLISVLLLQHVHQQQTIEKPPFPPESFPDSLPKRRKVSFFLVNLVPLVHQQSSVIAGNSNLSVGKLYGELKDTVRLKRNKLTVDSWREPQWSALLESHQVIVSTAQCFLDALIHGFVKMNDLNLLIFDEVHHALKNHPSFRIMKYYRLASEEERPKIFGMTASPIFTSTGHFDEASRYLQKTMNARIHTVSKETLQDLREVKQKREEIVMEFDPYYTVLDDDLLGVPLSKLSRDMIDRFGRDPDLAEDADLDAATECFEKEVRPKLEYTMRHLGPLGCDLLWHTTLLEYRSRARKWATVDRTKRTLVNDDWVIDASLQSSIVTRTETQETNESSDSDGDPLAATQSTVSGLGLGLAVAHLSTNSELNQRILLRMRSQPQLPDSLSFNASNTSHKVLRLIEVLKCFEPSAKDFCAIIFVERRQTATLLVELIKRVPGLEFIHAEFLLGHENGYANVGAPGMDWHDQVQVLNRFRRRKPTNLLVATSIAEEGLDIQAANLVIRFDLFNRHISFLQSRGRARAKGSRFILMAESGNRDQAQVILDAFNTEANRAKWLDGIADSDHDASFWDHEWQHKLHIEADEAAGSEECIYEPKTGARLFPEDAPTLISHYAATLHSEYFKDAVLAYALDTVENGAGIAKTFTCVLRLPSTSAVRSVDSGECSTKKQAKRMAAFKACKQLRELGDLDEWLMPKLIDKSPLLEDSVGAGKINPHHKAWRGTGSPIQLPVKKMDGWARLCASAGEEVTVAYHGTYLALDVFDPNCQPLLLLTRGPLPSTKLLNLTRSSGGRLKEVPQKALGLVTTLSEEELESARQFTNFVFPLISSRKDGQSGSHGTQKRAPKKVGEPAVLVVPVCKVDSTTEVRSAADLKLDFPSTLATSSLDLGQTNIESLKDKILVRQHGYHTHSFYKFESVRHDLSPSSAINQTTSTTDSEETQTYLSQHLKRYGRFHASRAIAPEAMFDVLSCELANTPLVEVTKLPKLQNLLTPSPDPRSSLKTTTHLVIPYFYRLHPLPFALLSSILLLPSILIRYDQLLLAHFCNAELFASRLDLDSLLEALTLPAAASGFDYERLEFLGDTFLKLVASCHTFTTRLSRTEGELHLANKGILTNVRLREEGERKGLERWVVGRSAGGSGRGWKAPVMDEVGGKLVREEEGEEVEVVREKVISDVVEALIGCALLQSTEQALFVCRTFSLLPDTIRTMSDFNALLVDLKQLSIDHNWSSRIDLAGLTHLQTLFCHTYTYPHLALEAFTHPSLLASVLPSYQRLEFLGDAWLDFYIVRYIFAKHPNLSPGELTTLKGVLASNSTLSAMGVRLGLERFVASDSDVLSDTIGVYAQEMKRLEEEGGVQYWLKLKQGVVVPKAVADVVEASFASIVVDSGFDERVGEEVFGRVWRMFYDEWCRWEDLVVRDLKRVVGFVMGVVRRVVVKEGGGEGAVLMGIRSSLQGEEEKERMVSGDEIVETLLSEVWVELVVAGETVGQVVVLPKSLGHLQRAKGIVKELDAVQRRLKQLLSQPSQEGNSDEETIEDLETEPATTPSTNEPIPHSLPRTHPITSESLLSALDEQEYLLHQLARTLGWKMLFQPLTSHPSRSSADSTQGATDDDAKGLSLAQLRALVSPQDG